VVKAVLAGSAGEKAGLMPLDEVLAIGDNRLTTENRKTLMSSYRPGEHTSLLVARRGRIIHLDITLDVAIIDKYDIKLRSDYRPSHIKRLEKLLGQKIP
jgi:predicted metalloprotease with PDZ domain